MSDESAFIRTLACVLMAIFMLFGLVVLRDIESELHAQSFEQQSITNELIGIDDSLKAGAK